MNDSMDALQSQFRQLRLVETASELPELFRKAEQASWTYRELVQEIVCFELRKREEKSVQKRLKWAKCLWQDKSTYNCSAKVHNSASSLG